jgi:ankyrin repeat protein
MKLKIKDVIEDFEKVKILLEKGADVNEKDEYGDTPLMIAACNLDTKTVKLLLENGADVNSQDKYGDTALSIIIKKSYIKEKETKDLARLLVKHGADVNLVDCNGNSAYNILTSKYFNELRGEK